MSHEKLLTPREVAALFRVRPQTITRWVHDGRFPAGVVVRTPGGHSRFQEPGVRKLLDGEPS